MDREESAAKASKTASSAPAAAAGTRSRRRLPLVLAAAAGITAGCVSVNVTYLDPAFPSPRRADAVELLRTDPVRAYKVVARFRFEDRGWNFSKKELERRIRKEAAALGGEAVIVDERVDSHFVAEGLLIGHTAQVSQRVVSAKVVVFTGTGAP